MEQKIHVLLVEDEILVMEAIAALLALEPNICVVGKALTAAEALALAQQVALDVIILDLELPDRSGIEVAMVITQTNPVARVIMLTGHTDPQVIVAAFQAGAVGCVWKTQTAAALVAAIVRVHQGHSLIPPAVAALLLRQVNQTLNKPVSEPAFSETELRVLTRVAQGQGNKEIARALALSPATVGFYVSRLLRKLHLTNRTQATVYAIKQGLVTAPPFSGHRRNHKQD
jgi:two-component system, NarL family, response regulator LiaR